jgi:hypothetical protein
MDLNPTDGPKALSENDLIPDGHLARKIHGGLADVAQAFEMA